MAKYIKELKYTDTATSIDYYVDTRAIKDADDTTKTLKQTLDGKQATLPNASASGKVLKSTNTTGGVEWGEAGGLPSQSGQSGKFLTTNGTSASWGTVAVPVVVQTTGTSTTDVMSQNAVTQALKPLISITQTANQTITVTCNGTAHTSSFNADMGSTITAINVAAVAGYNAGTATVDGSSTYNLPITVTASTAIAASPATKATYTFTITQSTGQTITVTCAGVAHTSTFTANYGDTWTATLEAASGYTAGELSADSGTVTGNTEVHASPATPNVPIWPNYETSTSGRKFGRHATLPGTVMQWNDNGTTRTTLILDAAHRTKKNLYSDSSTNLNLTPHRQTGYFTSTGSSVSLPTDPTQFTDTSLNTKAMATQDARSSTVATNEWMNNSQVASYTDGAAYYVRNTLATTSGVMTACDFPTINCLTRMFGDMSIIDRFDPTASGSDYALTNWGSFFFAWSSSWCGNFYGSYFGLRVGSVGEVGGLYQGYDYAVFPVLEIG